MLFLVDLDNASNEVQLHGESDSVKSDNTRDLRHDCSVSTSPKSETSKIDAD